MNTNYCAAIDTSLFVYTNGKVGVCCSGSEYFGDVNNESLQDIFNKPRFIEIRNNLKNNVEDKYCIGCKELDNKAPGSSQKKSFNDSFDYREERKLELIDIRWSNVCNLSCRYCNTNDSSEWRRLQNLPIINVNKKYVESIFQEVESNRETISKIYLLGGEPLLQKHNERLLDIVRKDTKVDILTNLSVKLDNNKIYSKLKELPNVWWNLSFDNIGKRFEYVRHGADWDLFQSNLETIQNDFGKIKITFQPVYTIWNALNLKEYYDFIQKHEVRVKWQLALPKIDSDLKTDSFVVFGHSKDIIQRAIEELNNVNIEDPILAGLKNSLQEDIEQPNKSKKFLEWTERMEAFMPPVDKFQNLWPELFVLLNK